MVNNDGYSGFFNGTYRDATDLEEYVDRLARSGTDVLEWCLGPGGGVFTSDTAVGQLVGAGLSEQDWRGLRAGDRRAAATVARMVDEGANPVRVVSDAAHVHKMEVFASIRMAPFYPPPYDVLFNGPIWSENPQWRLVLPDGSRHRNLSLAHEEVRAFWLALVEEALDSGADGVSLDFLRHPPFVGRDQRLLEQFAARYHRQPSSSDPEWWRFRAEPVTAFIAAVRARLDAGGRRGSLAVRVDHANYLEHGLDVERWLESGLVDVLIVSQHGLGGFHVDLSPFVAMVKGTNCRLVFGEELVVDGHDLTPEEDREIRAGRQRPPSRRYLEPEEIAQRAHGWYEAGADGVHLFNFTDRHHAVLPHLSRIEDVEAFLNGPTEDVLGRQSTKP